MHDVDLLPLNPGLSYSYPSVGLFHVASPELHPRYHYPTFVGGILLVKREDFEAVNGMSNKYWGWGLEDDEFYVRLKEAGINVSRPLNITTGIENTFRHMHDRVVRKRDMAKCFNQREVTRRRDRQTGLRDVAYSVQGRRTVVVDHAPVTVVNVALRCNRTITPWCLCSEEKKASTSNLAKTKTSKKEPAR
ncbi:beta-1,4-galactosyltransferase 7 isoform X2 [Homalodisca vitripennis]|nr:beta-1,4-galactosyltransferase 7 isoform X2 [Homalodisca vitripennis]